MCQLLVESENCNFLPVFGLELAIFIYAYKGERPLPDTLPDSNESMPITLVLVVNQKQLIRCNSETDEILKT